LILEYQYSNDWGYNLQHVDLFRVLKVVDGEWGLFEHTFRLNEANFRWRIQNNDLKNSEYTVSNVMIRPYTLDIYKKKDEWVMKNNRFYLP
jgi:hypothetical protein